MRTVSRLSRWLCILVLLPLWPMAGQKPGELYVSPLKNFSVAVPAMGSEFARAPGAARPNRRQRQSLQAARPVSWSVPAIPRSHYGVRGIVPR